MSRKAVWSFVGLFAFVALASGAYFQRRESLQRLDRELIELPLGADWAIWLAPDHPVDYPLQQKYDRWEDNYAQARWFDEGRGNTWKTPFEELLDFPSDQSLEKARLWLAPETPWLDQLAPMLADGGLKITSGAWAPLSRSMGRSPFETKLPNLAVSRQVTGSLGLRALASSNADLRRRLDDLDAYVSAHLPPRTLIELTVAMGLIELRDQVYLGLARPGHLPSDRPLRLGHQNYFEWAADAVHGEMLSLAYFGNGADQRSGGYLAVQNAGILSGGYRALLDWLYGPSDLALAIDYLRRFEALLRSDPQLPGDTGTMMERFRSPMGPSLLFNPRSLADACMWRTLESEVNHLALRVVRIFYADGALPGDQLALESRLGEKTRLRRPQLRLVYRRLAADTFRLEADPSTLPGWYRKPAAKSNLVVKIEPAS